MAQLVKNLPAMWESWVRSLDWEDPLEKGMATHCSILAWEIPWTEESQGVGHDLVTKKKKYTHIIYILCWLRSPLRFFYKLLGKIGTNIFLANPIYI